MAQPNQPPQGQQNLDPKAVDIVTRLALAAMKIIFDPNISKQLIEMMRHGQPVNAVARAAVTVLGQLREKSKGVPPEAVMAIAPSAVESLSRLADAAKLFRMDPKAMAQAVALVKQQGLAQPAAAPAPAAASAQPAQPPAGGLISSPMGA